MKSRSSFAVALALGAASVAMVGGAPAFAQKKSEVSKATQDAQPKPSKAFKPIYEGAVKAFQSGDMAQIMAAVNGLRSTATNADDTYLLGSYLSNAGAKSQNGALAAEGLTLMADSSLTNPANKPLYLYQKGQVLDEWAKDFAGSAAAFEQAYNLGKRDKEIEINIADTYSKTGNFATSLLWIERAIDANKARGQAVPDNWYNVSVNYATKSGNPAAINSTMRKVLSDKPSVDFWYYAGVLLDQNYDLAGHEKLDLLRLLRKNNALTSSSLYLEYVEHADARRYPTEVLAVINEGVSKGIINASDIAFKQELTLAQNSLSSSRPDRSRDEAEARASAKGFLSLVTGDSLFATGQYAGAEAMYQLALDKGNIVDTSGVNQAERALTRLGMAQIEQGKYAEAKANMAKLVSKNRKEIGALWSVYADNLIAKPR